MCKRGFVPAFYGYIDRIDPSVFHPPLERFLSDKFQPSAILLEYLADTERLREIHYALVHHHDMYPKNILVASGDRIIWIDFDVATTVHSIGTRERTYCEYETEFVKSFGKLLVCLPFLPRLSSSSKSFLQSEDQAQGLPPPLDSQDPPTAQLAGIQGREKLAHGHFEDIFDGKR